MPSRGSYSGEGDRQLNVAREVLRERFAWLAVMTQPRGEVHEGFWEDVARRWVLDEEEELSRWQE